MNTLRRSVAAAIAGLSVLSAADALAQSYGPGSQTLTIGGAGFREEQNFLPGWLSGADGYFSFHPPSPLESPTIGGYTAPLALPEGARIQRVCMWVHDTDLLMDLSVSLEVVKLVYGGESPSQPKTVGGFLQSSLAPGYRSYCEDRDQTVMSRFDVDNDGTLDPVAWYVRARLPVSGDYLSLGGVQITWARQVSAPPGQPTFADVPDTHPFFAFIEALAASGVTGGCGIGIFCPDAPLTRGQMAVFLAKALGLHWVD